MQGIQNHHEIRVSCIFLINYITPVFCKQYTVSVLRNFKENLKKVDAVLYHFVYFMEMNNIWTSGEKIIIIQI